MMARVNIGFFAASARLLPPALRATPLPEGGISPASAPLREGGAPKGRGENARIRIAAALGAAAVCIAAAFPAAAGSLGTRFALVEMEDVVPGKIFAVRLSDGSYYSLRNDSGIALQAALECQRPGWIEPCPGTNFVAIPDTAWVAFHPAVLDLPPRSEAESLVTVAVPDAPENYGRHFEFHIRASAMAGQAGVALTSRVRLHTVQAEAAAPVPKAEKPREAEVRSLDPPRRPLWRRILLFWE